MLWRCPLHFANRPFALRWWAEQPPAFSKALLCEKGRSQEHIAAWKTVCKWAVRVFTSHGERSGRGVELEGTEDEAHEPASHTVSFPLEKNGHWILSCDKTQYTYCARCYIARRRRDLQFVHSAQCSKVHVPACPACWVQIQQWSPCYSDHEEMEDGVLQA